MKLVTRSRNRIRIVDSEYNTFVFQTQWHRLSDALALSRPSTSHVTHGPSSPSIKGLPSLLMNELGVGLAVVYWRRWVFHGFMWKFVVAVVLLNLLTVISGGLLFCLHVCFYPPIILITSSQRDYNWGMRAQAKRRRWQLDFTIYSRLMDFIRKTADG